MKSAPPLPGLERTLTCSLSGVRDGLMNETQTTRLPSVPGPSHTNYAAEMELGMNGTIHSDTDTDTDTDADADAILDGQYLCAIRASMHCFLSFLM